MEIKCKKCEKVKHEKSFPRYEFRVGSQIKTKPSSVCHKCRYGVNVVGKIFKTDQERSDYIKILLYKHVTKSDGCWIWNGCKNIHGYGEIKPNRVHMNASRASWIAHKGKIQKGLFVLHACDNRSCTNPDHLFLGTAKDNMQDMIKKGRNKTLRGEDCSYSKLNNEIVLGILEKVKNGISTSIIAGDYNITSKYVNEIKRGNKWAHVGDRTEIPVIESNKIIMNEEKVSEIRKKFREGYRVVDICKEYGVSRSTIDDIKKGRTWKLVT